MRPAASKLLQEARARDKFRGAFNTRTGWFSDGGQGGVSRKVRLRRCAMPCVSARRCCCSVVIALMLAATIARAQAPPAIQIFMPNGDRPPRELRLTLTRDDGRIETVFTDSKGKFQFTGDLGGIHDYMVTIEGDGQTFDTTTMSIRFLRGSVTYQPVFLNPHKGPPPPPKEVEMMRCDAAGAPDGPPADYERATTAANKQHAEAAID